MKFADIRSAFEQCLEIFIDAENSCLPSKDCWIFEGMRKCDKSEISNGTHVKVTHLPIGDVQRNACQKSRLGLWQIQFFILHSECACEKKDGYDCDDIIDCLLCNVENKSSVEYEKDGKTYCLNLFHPSNGRALNSRLPQALPTIEGDVYKILTVEIPYQTMMCGKCTLLAA